MYVWVEMESVKEVFFIFVYDSTTTKRTKANKGSEDQSWAFPLLSHPSHYLQNQEIVLDEISDVLLPFILSESLVKCKL